MKWIVLLGVVGFIVFLARKKKAVSARAHNSSIFLHQLWAKCSGSDFSFCDMVEVFMFTIVEKYFAYNPGKVRTAEFKVMLDDMAHEYLPECRERLLFLKNNISSDGYFSPRLTVDDTKAQEIINKIDSLDVDGFGT